MMYHNIIGFFHCVMWICLVSREVYGWDKWTTWSQCNRDCYGHRKRTRTCHGWCQEGIYCGGSCDNVQNDLCNLECKNGGYHPNGNFLFCDCPEGYTGSCCQYRFRCRNPDNIAYGHVSYSNAYYGERATYVCNKNYRLEGGDNIRMCTYDSWSGKKPTCVRINCGKPDNIANGVVSYTSTNFEAIATYHCNQHYNLTGGSSVRTCTASSVWSSKKPSCVYVNRCASQPCLNGAICSDLLDDYQCNCQSGWSGRHCEKDTQAPVMSDCPSDQTIYTTTHTLHINWTEPTFVDPMGSVLQVTANYPTSEFTFPWGDFTVQHVATKPSNGLQTECSFQFHVRPTPCDDLNIPVHGARVCNGWKTDYGRFCMVTCQATYTIDPTNHSYDTLYVCGASGNWTASGPLPDCKIHMSDVASITATQPSYPLYSYNSTCNDPASKLSIQTLYINTITADESFKGFCSKYADECVPQNVLVDC